MQLWKCTVFIYVYASNLQIGSSLLNCLIMHEDCTALFCLTEMLLWMMMMMMMVHILQPQNFALIYVNFFAIYAFSLRISPTLCMINCMALFCFCLIVSQWGSVHNASATQFYNHRLIEFVDSIELMSSCALNGILRKEKREIVLVS